MHRIRGRLTYANVMATIAVFIALGGASYAAVKLPKNSIGAKQIKNEAITGAKIKNGAITATKIGPGAITGADIQLGTLGTVPSATSATSAGSATNATHATSSDTATLASNAQKLEGMTAAQVASAAKLGCPSGTELVAGFCFERVERPEDTWTEAVKTCESVGRLLPRPAELAAYDLAKVSAPHYEWTDDIWYYTGTSEYLATVFEMTPAGPGIGAFGVFSTSKYPYRCVVAPGN